MRDTSVITEEHPAVLAWRQVDAEARTPTGVEPLKVTRYSAAYRLVGTGVVAKRAPRETALLERTIYEQILPTLSVSSLRVHGFLEDESEFCWLFLEDSGGVEASLDKNVAHRVSAARWFAQLHVAALHVAGCQLPPRDARHYLDELRGAIAAIIAGFNNPALRDSDRAMLDNLLVECHRLDSRWDDVSDRCVNLPMTLVHNDLQQKNIHVRNVDGSPSICVLDWEYSGWGIPAADIAALDLQTYEAIAGSIWGDIGGLACVGMVFRSVSAISWASTELEHASLERGLRNLRFYPAAVRSALTGLGLD